MEERIKALKILLFATSVVAVGSFGALLWVFHLLERGVL